MVRSLPKRLAAIAGLAVLLFLAFRCTAAYDLYRRRLYYGDAEAVAEQIRHLAFQIETINESSIREKMARDEFARLRALEVKIPLQSQELMWFRVNEMFTVGLETTGRILWMTDGKRAAE